MTRRLGLLRSLGAAALLLAGMLFASMLLPARAQAVVVCAMTSNGINFGTSTTGIGAITYTCTNYNTTPAAFTLCAGIGTPSYPGTPGQPQMVNAGGAVLNYNLYTNPGNSLLWTQITPVTTQVSIPAGIGNAVSGTINFYGKIATGQTAQPGAYIAFVYNTVLGFVANGLPNCRANPNADLSGLDFTLQVQANVVNACVIATVPVLSLGSVTATTGNATGTTALTVNCPAGTAYSIGLQPSNGNLNGAGVMAGTAGNTDLVPYQLRSQSATGPVWGNTATTIAVGNGVAGLGTGANQVVPVFATVTGTNFRPDTYSDTVTVSVNY